jgi:tartrate dehydratase alpha subunit/fumarate hydratase class I-like protein
MPFDENRLKEIIKEGVKEATEEQNEVREQDLFIGKAKPKYYKSYTDLA